ncbi:uncharacterized protein ACBR49_015499 isoform 2-T2 [Aulostomus maculatus]
MKKKYFLGEAMSALLREISKQYQEVANELQNAGYETDSDLQNLSREDLLELFPKKTQLKMRKQVFEIIHQQKPIKLVLRELKDFLPLETLGAALNSSGVVVDYLNILKDLRNHVNEIHTFLDAHINLLEDVKNQDRHTSKDSCHDGDMMVNAGQASSSSQRAPRYNPSLNPWDATHQDRQAIKALNGDTVRYKKVVCSSTFNADHQLLGKVETKDFRLLESSGDHDVVIVFCPITSRMDSDVDAAMANVKSDKPIILVLMHHFREPRPVPKASIDSKKVVSQVSVFYHQTISGLLECQQNDSAAKEIWNKLQQYRIHGSTRSSGYESRSFKIWK